MRIPKVRYETSLEPRRFRQVRLHRRMCRCRPIESPRLSDAVSFSQDLLSLPPAASPASRGGPSFERVPKGSEAVRFLLRRTYRGRHRAPAVSVGCVAMSGSSRPALAPQAVNQVGGERKTAQPTPPFAPLLPHLMKKGQGVSAKALIRNAILVGGAGFEPATPAV